MDLEVFRVMCDEAVSVAPEHVVVTQGVEIIGTEKGLVVNTDL